MSCAAGGAPAPRARLFRARMDPLIELTRKWFAALSARDAKGAARLVADDCRIQNPGGGDDLIGPAGARQLAQLAPPTLRRSIREERVDGTTVIVKGLTRLPGVFANYTTWTFETDGSRITRLTFAWRAAN